ncbi:MAG: DUF3048 domain-containing protein [Anaerolineales bacterium]|nr:DUF3048 domain-containing protein [Anaerolineales bacterium]
MKVYQKFLALVVFPVLVLSACSSEPEATATPTKTSAPVEIQSEATNTVVVQIPTFTPKPDTTPTQTSTPEPTPTEVIEGLIGPDKFKEGVNPLTGLTVDDPANLDRRPIAVKISNSPAKYVRPHSGLDKADLVFEHYAEGGVTRLTAVFYGQNSDKVGSVRSGRLIDLEIPAMYQAAFAYSGSSAGVKQKIRNVDFFDRVISPDFAYGEPYFYRVPKDGVAFEHTLFADLYDIWAWLDEKENNERPDLTGMAFLQSPPEGGTEAKTVQIGYIAYESQVEWVYSAGTGQYLRWQGGEAHKVVDGTQLSAANVIVVGAHHQNTDILEDTFGGGHYSIEIQVWGEGPASLFRDGMRYEGRWSRTNRDDVLSFTDLEGNVLPLKPGNTWFEMVPLGFDKLVVEP